MRTRIALIAVSLLACFAVACQDDGKMAVVKIEPQAGNAAGQQRVMIKGRNFRQDIGYTVFFGTEKAKSVTIKDPQTLVVQTPKAEPGTVDVTVRADDNNAFRLRQAFTFQEVTQGQQGPKAKDSNLAF